MIINTTPFPNSTGKGISLTLDICHTNSGEFLLLFSSRRSLQWDPKLKLKFRAAFVCSTSQATRHPFILNFLLLFALRNCWNRCQIVVHFVFFVAFTIVFVFLSILVVAPFVFVCFGSLTLRGLEFLWNTQAPCPETPSLGSSIDLQSSHRATWYVLTSVPKESGVPKVGVQHMCLLNFEISWRIMQSRVMSWPSQNYSMKLWLLKVYLKWVCLDHWS